MKRIIMIITCVVGMSFLGATQVFAQDVPKDTLKGGRNDPMYRNAPSRLHQKKMKADSARKKAATPKPTTATKKSSSGEDNPVKKDNNNGQTIPATKNKFPNAPEGGTVPKK